MTDSGIKYHREPLWPSIAVSKFSCGALTETDEASQIVFSVIVVLSSRWYGNLETGFAMIKVFGVLLLSTYQGEYPTSSLNLLTALLMFTVMMGIVINLTNRIMQVSHNMTESFLASDFALYSHVDPFRFWRKPIAPYDGIGGPTGRGLAFLTGFTNALVCQDLNV